MTWQMPGYGEKEEDRINANYQVSTLSDSNSDSEISINRKVIGSTSFLISSSRYYTKCHPYEYYKRAPYVQKLLIRILDYDKITNK